MRLWDLQKEPEDACFKTMTIDGGWVTAVTVEWGLQQALCACSNHTLGVWNLESGVRTTVLAGHTSSVKCVTVDWDHRRALSGSSDSSLKLWDLDGAACILTMEGHADPVRCVAMD